MSPSILPAQWPGTLEGMEGGGIVAARGAEELWKQRPRSRGEPCSSRPPAPVHGILSVPPY